MKTPRRLLWFSVLLALAFPYSALAAPVLQSEVARTPDEWCSASVPAADPVTRDFNSAEQVLQPGVDYRAIFCTEVGSVYVDLFESQTPVTVNNFVFLSQQGYYNNTTFHRVIQNFMAQGGDPTATGTGGPNYRFQDEFVASLRFDGPGKLAMANAGPGTNGSQFFITAAATPHLNDLHTIFGQVLSGQANVIGIRLRDPGVDTEPGTRLDTVIIITDPAAVRIESVDLPVRADVVTAMDRVDQIITPDVADLLENRKSNQAAEDVLAAQPEAARADAETALTAHNFQYRVSSIVNNKACDLNAVQFIDVGYRLDAFATVDDASAAAVDPAYAALLEKEGYIAEPSEALPHPVFRQTLTICDQPAVRAVTFWQRGPFVALIQITLPANSDGIESLGRILSEFVAQRIYEPLLLDVLYRDIQ